MSPDLAEQITDDAALGGRLRLLQPRKGHRFGHDAILLAAATSAKAGDHVVEFGAGVGAAGLAVAARVAGVRLTLVERDPALAQLAALNIERNGFSANAAAISLDVTASEKEFAAAGLAAGSADSVLMNPPFYDPERTTHSPDAQRRSAHIGSSDVLFSWVAAATRLLRIGGSLTLIYRADGRRDVEASLASHFGGTVFLPVLPKIGANPIRMIASAVKGSHAQARDITALSLNDAFGKPTGEAEIVLRHAAALKLGG